MKKLIISTLFILFALTPFNTVNAESKRTENIIENTIEDSADLFCLTFAIGQVNSLEDELGFQFDINSFIEILSLEISACESRF